MEILQTEVKIILIFYFARAESLQDLGQGLINMSNETRAKYSNNLRTSTKIQFSNFYMYICKPNLNYLKQGSAPRGRQIECSTPFSFMKPAYIQLRLRTFDS